VLVDPLAKATGGLALALWTVPPDLSGSISINGSSVPLTLATPGQNARLTLTGTAGKKITVRLAPGSIASTNLSILRPDSSVLAGPKKLPKAGGTLVATLPANGTYTIVVDPVTYRTGSVGVSVTSP
jgi:hypothetical protein